MASKPRIAGAPGLELVQRTDGNWYALWRAPREAIKEGYLPKSVRLDLDPHLLADHDGIRQACQREQSNVEHWFAERTKPTVRVDTMRELSRLYQTHEASPFHGVKFNTMRNYVYELKMIEETIGDRRLDRIHAVDFKRWHQQAVDSVDDGGIRKAQGLIKRIRAIISFGVIAELDECRRLDTILSKMEFPTPSRRRSVMTFDMAAAVIAKAHEMARPSVALAQALQFETGLRQADVVGLWGPCNPGDTSPFRTGKLKWVSGLRWQEIGDDLVLTLDTSKTGSTVTHALFRMPLVVAELERIPIDRRTGPVIVNEETGMPYLPLVFSRNWRKIARAAGVPDDIWNRDSRAGAISEGDEAGATIAQLQRMAGHSTAKMTGRYVRGDNVETSATVAQLRAQKRKKT